MLPSESSLYTDRQQIKVLQSLKKTVFYRRHDQSPVPDAFLGSASSSFLAASLFASFMAVESPFS
jgi:hypothetical protein